MLVPETINTEQIQILENSISVYQKKINQLTASQEVMWHYFEDSMKENFLEYFMKERGIKFINKDYIKEVIKRKRPARKAGKRPKNNLKLRVKNKNK